MGFIADKTTELRTAVQNGDSTRSAQIITETVLESGRSFEDTIREMTDTDRRQQRRT
ncbi:hypothetical protein ACTWJ9_33665 (plasmid) [Streptomyces sp. GDS52]|uniref:hypothetical protein n=1 Tax=Streptomyces sp. GDS52 TaxID=3406419 RepID=UPI003FD3C60A